MYGVQPKDGIKWSMSMSKYIWFDEEMLCFWTTYLKSILNERQTNGLFK